MNQREQGKQIIFWVDNEQFRTDKHELTVGEILHDFAKEDPAETSLVRRHGNDLEKYADITMSICLENGMKFIVFHNGPTPVS